MEASSSGIPVGSVTCADNLAFMQTLPAACCDLIYVDPPFFSGRQQRRSNDHVVHDHWPDGLQSYLEFLRPRFVEMHRLLKETATLYVHLDWHAVHHAKVLLDEIFGYENFLNEIIWSYRTGGRNERWFARKHDTILLYARRIGQHKFHVLRAGKFRTDGLNYDENGRPYKNTKKGRLYFNPEGPAMTDVWEIPFLSTVSLERNGYPTQKPDALLERIILASSDPGDLVADFFCGSGTTLAVAQRLGRAWIGSDIADQAVQLARRRLEPAEPLSSNDPPQQPPPFGTRPDTTGALFPP
jgi:site-specific DNA-methyltransferase (adenine-specific)/adenine-specific DNA-methyltransferase